MRDLGKRTYMSPETGNDSLAQRLDNAIDGDVLFDVFSRGRYATDASIYQIDPIGVTVPRSSNGVRERDRE